MTISPTAVEILLNDAITRDRTTARRAALFNILQHECCLTREQLITRVEGLLGKGAFGGSAWMDTFFRDMQVVKQALLAAGCQLAYSRKPMFPGYYLRNQPPVSSQLSAILDGSIAEVDPSQIAIFKKLSFRQRFQQGCSISSLASQVVGYRTRTRNPQISPAEARRLAIQKGIFQ
jgi:hypothetical protein